MPETELWLCDKCGETYEFELVERSVETAKYRPKLPNLTRQHDAIHKAKGENYSWIVLTKIEVASIGGE